MTGRMKEQRDRQEEEDRAPVWRGASDAHLFPASSLFCFFFFSLSLVSSILSFSFHSIVFLFHKSLFPHFADAILFPPFPPPPRCDRKRARGIFFNAHSEKDRCFYRRCREQYFNYEKKKWSIVFWMTLSLSEGTWLSWFILDVFVHGRNDKRLYQ